MSRIQIDELLTQREVKTRIRREIEIPKAAERLLEVDCKLVSVRGQIAGGNLLIEGVIKATADYVAEDTAQGMETHATSFSFNESIPFSGSTSRGAEGEVVVDAEVDLQEFDLKHPRQIGISVDVLSNIQAYAREKVAVPAEIPGIETKLEELNSTRGVAETEAKRRIRSRQALPAGVPAVGWIQSSRAMVSIIDIEVLQGKIQVAGTAQVDIVYLPEGERVIRATTVNIPFTEVIKLDGVRAGMHPFVDVVVVDAVVRLRDPSEVIIDLHLVLRPLVVIEEPLRVPVPVRPVVTPSLRELLVEEIVARERTRIMVTGTIVIPAEKPPARRIIRATGRIIPGTLVINVEAGGVFIEGDIEVDVLYVANLPAQPVFFVAGRVRFAQFISIPGVLPTMRATVDVRITDVRTLIIDPRRLEVRPVLDVSVLVTVIRVIEIVITPPLKPVIDPPPAKPDVIVVTVRPGDTLFQIARRFGTTVAAIQKLNNLPDPNRLQVGQKILVPRH